MRLLKQQQQGAKIIEHPVSLGIIYPGRCENSHQWWLSHEITNHGYIPFYVVNWGGAEHNMSDYVRLDCMANWVNEFVSKQEGRRIGG